MRSNRVNSRRAPFGMVGPTMRPVLSISGSLYDALRRCSINHYVTYDVKAGKVFLSVVLQYLFVQHPFRYVLANTLKLYSYYSTADAMSLESLHQAFSVSILFECGCSVPRIASSRLQRLHIIRVWILYHSNRFIRPSLPLYYSSVDALSLKSLHQAFNAFILFECGRFVPRIASSGLQRLHIIRVRTLCPSNRFIRPLASPYFSSMGCLVLWIPISGCQCFHLIFPEKW
jgi:hypothetical protein